LQKRLRQVEERATAQRKVEQRIAKTYQQASDKALDVSSIGGSALPVVTVEVTPQTLPKLAAQPDVVAILPNQKIELIRPQRVEYEELRKQEVNHGQTWTLEFLGIDKLWPTTKGKDINVAVLDTGVYGDHPVLAGRVTNFVLIDPLGRRINTQPTFDAGRHGTHVCGIIAGGRTPEKVAIGVAPGAQIYSCIPPTKQADGTFLFTYMDGTSMATPHVAGVAALLMSAHPTAPVTAIMQALKETARHPSGEQRRPDNRWGQGLIQPEEALHALA
jgi:subtilisin family serine protease